MSLVFPSDYLIGCEVSNPPHVFAITSTAKRFILAPSLGDKLKQAESELGDLQVKLDEFMDSDRPVLVDFIFGTCTTICPVMSAGYSNLQRKLGEESEQVRLVSISIDPEHDTPEVMKSYLQRYRAKPGWDFLTGSRADIDKVMRAFDAYVPDKMSHRPVMFLRAPGEKEWIRIYGLVSTRELMEEYRQLLED